MTESAVVKTINAVKSAFRGYYFKPDMVEAPDKMEQREFGYMQFGQPGMVRHLSFKSMKELTATIMKEVPSDIYCSNAYYRFPTYPMQEKQWLGADLIFDIDGKDLHLPCVPSHSYPICTNCGHASAPVPDEKRKEEHYSCPACGGKKADDISIPCAKCIEGSKREVKRLVEFLTGDLGMQRSDIHIYFSGNNGFHIHVSDEAYIPLDPQARSDLVGYLSGSGLMAESIGVRKGNAENLFFIKFPKSGLAYGWRGRVANKLKIDGSSMIKLKHIVEQKGGYAAFKADLDRMTRDIGVRIDPQVTTDVHRVFRMSGTLNSKSGLAKIKCGDNIDSFDPFVDACLLGDGKLSVKVKTQVKLKLKNKSFNISKESAELPAYAAIYLICKRLAEAS
ncbi:DNA primase, small subunit [Candidatus Nitrososphaera gargensis Ga9.2]|uniref:DNA primase small subunit PriS n=1 Tax=Nitrososphaera gargensis (strain Ga9.2) TaxID=1237085 RepID=K0IN08_NITGG|nr:DNA primase small subunit domain-containing protein [Candidatus Nitrososphaera gargensis]AFU58549.1 DNA primase, small subunit [Candidatus Nitrososphaera gargensis Ga9.2]